MGSGVIEIDNIRLEKSEELLRMENQEMIRTFAPHTPQKAFAESICLRRPVRRSKDFDATRRCHSCKMLPEFLIVIPNHIFGACPYGVASRNCCATQGSVGARVTLTWMTLRDFSSMMKKAKSGRKKRSGTWRKSQAHTSACAGYFGYPFSNAPFRSNERHEQPAG